MPRALLFPLNPEIGRSLRQIGQPHLLAGRQPLPATYLRIFGVTKDAADAPLGGCAVHLFRTADDVEVDQVVSDGSGNYEFRSVSLTPGTFYVVAYLPGSPDVAGTTVNTLAGS